MCRQVGIPPTICQREGLYYILMSKEKKEGLLMKNIECYCKELGKDVNIELNVIYQVCRSEGKFENGYNAEDRHNCCKHINKIDDGMIRFVNCKYLNECSVGQCRYIKLDMNMMGDGV